MPIEKMFKARYISEEEFREIDFQTIGEQKVHLLNNNVAFKISVILKDQQKYEQQLHKFLCFTPFRAIQLINFKRESHYFQNYFSVKS